MDINIKKLFGVKCFTSRESEDSGVSDGMLSPKLDDLKDFSPCVH